MRLIVAMIAACALINPALGNGSDNGHNNGNGHQRGGGTGIGVGMGGAGGNARAAGGNARSRSAAAAGANAAITQNIYGGGTAATNDAGGGHYRATIRNTPDVYAPALAAGTNPCTHSASGGGAVAGFGLSFGGSWSGENCEVRNAAALTHAMGQPELAQEILCDIATVRQARQRLGRPCVADQVPMQSVSIRPTAPVMAPAPVATIPDWCHTASIAERRRHPVCR